MKTKALLLLTTLMLCAQVNAQASIDYFSWCSDDNKVMQLDQDYQVITKVDCNDTNKQCKEYENPIGRNVAVFAVCE